MNILKKYIEQEIFEQEFKKENILNYEENIPESEPVQTIKNGCIICNSDIKGNSQLGYYCKNCNLIFKNAQYLNNTKNS